MTSNPTNVPDGYVRLKAPRPGFMWIALSQEEANRYTQHLCLKALEELKPKPKPKPEAIPHRPQTPHTRLGAFKYACRCVHERFKTNPYGIGAGWFYVVIAAAFVFSMGNMIVGTIEAIKSGHGIDAHLAMAKGFLAQLPVVWMLIGFCFPALIANMAEQFRALHVNVTNV